MVTAVGKLQLPRKTKLWWIFDVVLGVNWIRRGGICHSLVRGVLQEARLGLDRFKKSMGSGSLE